MRCSYEYDKVCTNKKCPRYAYLCLTPDDEGVCRYEDRVDENYKLTPKACLLAAMLDSDIELNNRIFNDIWNRFANLMAQHGYVEEVE